MPSTNGSVESAANHERFSGIRTRVHDLLERAHASSAAAQPKMRAAATKATDLIKAHPIAALAGAFAIGYVVMRLARRESDDV